MRELECSDKTLEMKKAYDTVYIYMYNRDINFNQFHDLMYSTVREIVYEIISLLTLIGFLRYCVQRGTME